MDIQCKTCGKSFKTYQSAVDRGKKYCSRKCFANSDEQKARFLAWNHEQKGKPLSTQEKQRRSEQMKRLNAAGLGKHFGPDNVWYGKTLPCVKYGPESSSWKGGRKLTRYGYVYALSHGHPRATKSGYVLEHILVMEKHIGRHITTKEAIHHKNGVRDDNRIDNLELIPSKGEHTRMHWADGSQDNRPKIPPVKLNEDGHTVCLHCGVVNPNQQLSRKRKFCSKKCQGSFQRALTFNAKTPILQA